MPNTPSEAPSRRGFFQTLGAGALAAVAARPARAAAAHIEILPGEIVGTISPDIYGHFTEHIGGVIYGGIWVGEDSKIPNQGGVRTALVEAMRALRPSVIRWPGGCFADSYNWRDGVGPRARRPQRANFWINELEKAPDGPYKYEPNHFGTNEFMRFVRLVGGEPYLAANVRSLPPQDFSEWVEYCNAPAGSSTLADLRGGEPFGVRYWGVGNESWGCGGDFAPDDYAVEYRRFTSFVPKFGVPLRFIAAGPNGGDLDWTRRFFAKLAEGGRGPLNRTYGWALHYYCSIGPKREAIDFAEKDWYAILAAATRMEDLVKNHWAAMGEVDRNHKVKLVVDEWGAWYRSGTEIHPGYLFCQVPTLRDALITGLTLDTFNRHAEKVVMANVAQLVNNLHALFLARDGQFTVTPNYHAFRMYGAHAGAQSVRALFSAPAIAVEGVPGANALPGLAGSASLRGKRLVVTAVNPHASEPLDAAIVLRGAKCESGTATVLAASALNAHNTFEHPRAVEPVQSPVRLKNGVYRFAPASVTRLDLDLQ